MVAQGPENGRRPGEVKIVRAASDRGVGTLVTKERRAWFMLSRSMQKVRLKFS